MKHRIMSDIWVKTEADAKKIYDAVHAKKALFQSASKQETWTMNYHRCFHDEPINKPCEIIEKDSGKSVI